MPAERPSELTEGLPRAILRMMEEASPDDIHGGVAPSHWVAAAHYVHGYIMMKDTRQVDVAKEFGCGVATVSRLYRRVVASTALDRAYGPVLPLRSSIASMLAERRATVGMIAIRLGETEKKARQRMKAAEHNANVRSELFATRRFYWTDEPNKS